MHNNVYFSLLVNDRDWKYVTCELGLVMQAPLRADRWSNSGLAALPSRIELY